GHVPHLRVAPAAAPTERGDVGLGAHAAGGRAAAVAVRPLRTPVGQRGQAAVGVALVGDGDVVGAVELDHRDLPGGGAAQVVRVERGRYGGDRGDPLGGGAGEDPGEPAAVGLAGGVHAPLVHAQRGLQL